VITVSACIISLMMISSPLFRSHLNAGTQKDASQGEKKSNKKTSQKVEKKKQSPQSAKDKEKRRKKEERLAKWIATTLDYGIQRDRKEALNRILTIKDRDIRKRVEKKLIEIIGDELDLEIKIKAITIAGELELREALPELKTALNDKSDDVKVSAVFAIKSIGDTTATATLINKLKEQDLRKNSTLIGALIDTLGKFKATQMSTYAMESIKNENTDNTVRGTLVLFLGRVEAKGTKPFLNSLLKDADEEEMIRAYAASALARLDAKEAAGDIAALIEEIEHYTFTRKKKHHTLYMHCIAALAKLGDEKAFPRLLNLLRSDNAMIRLKAIALIKEIKNKRTIDILQYKVKYDPSPKVQRAAREALQELGVNPDDDSKKGKTREERKPGN